ncbi:MAG: histidine kinase [Muribaculaceae bacterium]|nr:histidine kinase [Muribaculaceae bacterium]
MHRLSGLLRYMLYEDAPRVPLNRDVEFIEDYVSLMRLRLSGREAIINIDLGDHDSASVPLLLFIPLVENAFKYGVDATDDTPIDIDIRAEAGSVVCTTTNAYNPAATGVKRQSSGIGLANLRRRLTLIYSGKASLTTSSDGHIYKAILRIPI